MTKSQTTSLAVAGSWHLFLVGLYIVPQVFLSFGQHTWVIYVTILSVWSLLGLLTFFHAVFNTSMSKWSAKFIFINCALLVLPLYLLWVLYLNRLQS